MTMTQMMREKISDLYDQQSFHPNGISPDTFISKMLVILKKSKCSNTMWMERRFINCLYPAYSFSMSEMSGILRVNSLGYRGRISAKRDFEHKAMQHGWNPMLLDMFRRVAESRNLLLLIVQSPYGGVPVFKRCDRIDPNSLFGSLGMLERRRLLALLGISKTYVNNVFILKEHQDGLQVISESAEAKQSEAAEYGSGESSETGVKGPVLESDQNPEQSSTEPSHDEDGKAGSREQPICAEDDTAAYAHSFDGEGGIPCQAGTEHSAPYEGECGGLLHKQL